MKRDGEFTGLPALNRLSGVKRLERYGDNEIRLMAKNDTRKASRRRETKITSSPGVSANDAMVPVVASGDESARDPRVTWVDADWSQLFSRDPSTSTVASVEPSWNAVEVRSETSSPAADWPCLPRARGTLSEYVISTFASRSGSSQLMPSVDVEDAMSDDDLQLALFLCYELHYRDVASAEWEWDPRFLSFRAELERAFLLELRELTTTPTARHATLAQNLDDVIGAHRVTPVSDYLSRHGSLKELREYCVHLSVSQLKNSDAQAFGVARLQGAAKAAMVQIQFGDHGGGISANSTTSLFARMLTSLRLDPSYGAYVGQVPGASLASANLESFFGLHRRWRGAMVGQVAAMKMTCVESMERCARAMEHAGVHEAGAQYFQTRSRTDALNALIARNRLVGALVHAEPEFAGDVLFGARSHLLLEDRLSKNILSAWSQGRSSLLSWGVGDGETGRGSAPNASGESVHAMSAQRDDA